ncbi:MAG: ABC transporter, partial [Verrucomicrobiota bacterium]
EQALPLLIGQPRPVRLDMTAPIDERLEVTQLFGTSEDSWGERNYRSEQPPVQSRGDIPGPVPVASLAERSVGEQLGLDLAGGRLVVFGNADFIANNRLYIHGNRFLFLNAVNWAIERDELLDIPPKRLETYQLVLSDASMTNLLLSLMAVPGGVALLGGIVWLLRQR